MDPGTRHTSSCPVKAICDARGSKRSWRFDVMPASSCQGGSKWPYQTKRNHTRGPRCIQVECCGRGCGGALVNVPHGMHTEGAHWCMVETPVAGIGAARLKHEVSARNMPGPGGGATTRSQRYK